MRIAVSLLGIAVWAVGCHEEPTPRLVAVLESLEADTEEPPLCMGGNCGRSLSGGARLENQTADTLAFAAQGEQAYEFAVPPSPEAPGAFALIFGADTVRVTVMGDSRESTVLVLPPGSSQSVRFRVTEAYPPPSPPGTADDYQGGEEKYWGPTYSTSTIVALAERLPEAELVYLPNPAGRYPYRVTSFAPVDTLGQAYKAWWYGRYWAQEVVRFTRAPAGS